MIDKAQTVDEGVDDIGALVDHGVVQEHDLLHTGAQHGAQREHKEHHNDGADGGQGDVPDLLPAVCAVQSGGFVQRGIHIGDGRQEDDHVIAHVLPYIGHNDNDGEPGIASQEHDRINAELGKQSVDHAVVLEQAPEHAAHDGPGEEVGQEKHGLRDPHELGVDHFVEQQRQDQGHQQAQDDLADGNGQRIAHHIPERGQRHHVPEILQAHPGGIGKAAQGREILEGHGQSEHGKVRKDQSECHTGDQHQIQWQFLLEDHDFTCALGGELLSHNVSSFFDWGLRRRKGAGVFACAGSGKMPVFPSGRRAYGLFLHI